MKVFYFAALMACLTISSLAKGQMIKVRNNDKAVQQIIDFKNQYIEAEENKDIAYLDNILADNFYALNPQGQLLDKTHQLENIKRTDRNFKVLNPREIQVYFYNNYNVAILFEHVTVDGEDKGRHFGGEFRFVRLFVKQHGSWHVALAQATSLAPSPKTGN